MEVKSLIDGLPPQKGRDCLERILIVLDGNSPDPRARPALKRASNLGLSRNWDPEGQQGDRRERLCETQKIELSYSLNEGVDLVYRFRCLLSFPDSSTLRCGPTTSSRRFPSLFQQSLTFLPCVGRTVLVLVIARPVWTPIAVMDDRMLTIDTAPPFQRNRRFFFRNVNAPEP